MPNLVTKVRHGDAVQLLRSFLVALFILILTLVLGGCLNNKILCGEEKDEKKRQWQCEHVILTPSQRPPHQEYFPCT
jgi:hypothetical protein